MKFDSFVDGYMRIATDACEEIVTKKFEKYERVIKLFGKFFHQEDIGQLI